MQTSFMHPPFGFALFYLRSVAPANDYKDKVTGKTIAKMTTGQIYWGAVPFVLIQVFMVGLIIFFPNIVSGGLGKAKEIDTSTLKFEAQPDSGEKVEMDASKLFGTPSGAASAPATPPATAPASAPAASRDPLENAAQGAKK
jgi:hypothetical protein